MAKYRLATENMIDAYGVLGTELSEKLLAEKIFLSPRPNHDNVKRVLTHIVSNDKPPHEVIITYCISISSLMHIFPDRLGYTYVFMYCKYYQEKVKSRLKSAYMVKKLGEFCYVYIGAHNLLS